MIGASVILSTAAAVAGSQPTDPPVRIADRPARTAVVQNFTGSYEQHPRASAQFMAVVRRSCRPTGVIFGEYPDDPDVVGPQNARWRLGYEVRDAHSCAALAAPLSLARIEGGKVITLKTRLGRAKEDGLKLYSWIPANGYVQVGPTRMEYIDENGDPNGRVRIVVPVKSRTWARGQ